MLTACDCTAPNVQSFDGELGELYATLEAENLSYVWLWCRFGPGLLTFDASAGARTARRADAARIGSCLRASRSVPGSKLKMRLCFLGHGVSVSFPACAYILLWQSPKYQRLLGRCALPLVTLGRRNDEVAEHSSRILACIKSA